MGGLYDIISLHYVFQLDLVGYTIFFLFYYFLKT